MEALVEHHRRACDGFARVVRQVPQDAWSASTPCSEWNARDLVEHVIGFHEFLLLRPLGIRVKRPRDDPAARWDASADALFVALALEGVLDRPTELPGGGESTPRTMLAALTTDVLVHTWDLARSVTLPADLDEELCEHALHAARTSGVGREAGMVGPEIEVAEDASPTEQLVAFYGRDTAWSA